jgi:hypothetical protein
MNPEFNPLVPTGAAMVVGLILLVMVVASLAALVREGRRGGNVALWLIAFLIGGPITLLVYGATQFQEPSEQV